MKKSANVFEKMFKKTIGAYQVLGLLIFLVGFSINLLPSIILLTTQTKQMTTWQAMQLQYIFFICHSLTVIPGFILIKKLGPDQLTHHAIQICLTALLIIGAITQWHFTKLLPASIGLLACALGLLKVTINSKIIDQQKDHQYHKYTMKLMCADTIGAITSPIITSYFIMPNQNNFNCSPIVFFIALGACYCIALSANKKNVTNTPLNNTPIKPAKLTTAIKNKTVQSGFWMTFIFIGLEFSIPLFIGLIANSMHNEQTINPSWLISTYWMLILMGRVSSFRKNKKERSPNAQITQGSLCAMMLIYISMMVDKPTQVIILACVGFFNAKLFPAIFSLHTKNIPQDLHYSAGAIFLTALSGGAIIPFCQTYLGKALGLTYSFNIIIICYVILIWRQNSLFKESQTTTRELIDYPDAT